MGEIVDIQRRARSKRRPSSSKTALVLAGGGFVGGVYQIGALRALDLVAENYSVNDFDMYIGTSCGGFVGALIANGATPEHLMRVIDGQRVEGYEPLNPRKLLRPDYRGILGTGRALPGRAVMTIKDLLFNLHRLSLVDMLAMAADLAPSGFYSLDAMSEHLEAQLRIEGYTNDFRELGDRELYIVSTDLDSCKQVVFGDAGWDDVPISQAAAASAALPMVFRAVEIKGRRFVDGGLSSLANIEVAVDHGAKLVVIVNPIVPYIANEEALEDFGDGQRVSDRGLFNVAAQAFKLLVWSGVQERVAHWRETYPDVDFILIEPRTDDELMFSTQIMNTSQRVQIARHGFESVTVMMEDNFAHYREICGRHGIKLTRRKVIDAMEQTKGAESGTARWRRILERRGLARSS